MNALSEILNLPCSAGSIDSLVVSNGRISVHGWMMHPYKTFDHIEALLDGMAIGNATPLHRPDVEAALKWSTNAKPSSFVFETQFEAEEPERIDFVGYVKTQPVARLSCLIPVESDNKYPIPPNHLAERVSGASGNVFRMQGLKMFTDLIDQMNRYAIPLSGRFLDWGCGCGRVTSFLLSRLPEVEITGCDIDAEAIDWCDKNLPAKFTYVKPEPPLPFETSSLTVAIGCSVFTHLDRHFQERWFAEIKRVLVPGGHLFASTHGEYAYHMAFHGEGSSAIPASIIDSIHDGNLDGIAPPGYYRGTYQSRKYTTEIASRYFEVVEYIECGLNGHQDLVILRKKKRRNETSIEQCVEDRLAFFHFYCSNLNPLRFRT